MGKKLFIWSRKIHRWTLHGVTFLILIMGGTGLMMKYPSWASFFGLGGSVRFVHNQLSPWFASLLGVMMITGLYMYWYPAWTDRKRKKSQQPATATVDKPVTDKEIAVQS